ncbi:MAG: gamma-glutamyltransferase [Phycisphaerae bacterium]
MASIMGFLFGGVLMVNTWTTTGDRPIGNPAIGRSVVMATHGAVATSHPLAAQAGIDILKQGGNAVDAAIAANAVLGVVEPMSCGIGGDLFAIVWDAKSRKLYGLNASGRSPYAASIEYFRSKGMDAIPRRGPLSWSVPGCVDGWELLRSRFGSKSFAEILAPAVGYAREGFPVTEIIGYEWGNTEALLKASPDAAKTYLKHGRAPRVGEKMTNPYIAATYERIAGAGAADFYKGDIAQQIAAFSKANGGLLTLKDLEDHRSTWVDPVSTTYRGYEVWELPPNSQGIAVLEILNLLEPFDIRSMGHNSAEFLHLYIEAKKLAYADRARFYADPEVAKDLPIKQLISKEYAAAQRKRIDLQRAALEVPPGDPMPGLSETVYVTVVDKDRNAVSLIQSIFLGWGSGLVPGNLGFALQNRGMLFSLDPSHPNRIEPHKRPFHTIIPAMVTRDGLPWFCFGVMGGDMQPQGQVQVLCNLIDHGMNVQEAGESARCAHYGSSTPTGKQMTDGGEVIVESGISDEVIAALKTKGHKVTRGRGGFGGYQGILIDHANGVLQAASDPRKDGAAIGY